MPSIPKKVKKACRHCRFYRLGPYPEPGDGGGPYCLFHKQPFPDATKWTRNGLAKKPGDRVCNDFEWGGGKK